MNKEYTPAEAKAWLNGYDEGKKKKQLIGLTDEEIRKLSNDCVGVRDETEFIRAIEAKLKEKNA